MSHQMQDTRTTTDVAAPRAVPPRSDFSALHLEHIEQAISEKFEQQAARYPDRIAIHSRQGDLTYEALNRAANRVARALVAVGGEREHPVATLIGLGPMLFIGLLGIMKAGTIYMPLDDAYPRTRIEDMLGDSTTSIILSDKAHLALAMALAGGSRQVLNIEDLDPTIADTNLDVSVSPEQVATLLYTSGSTGRPKGIPFLHRNQLLTARNMTNSFRVTAEDRVTHVASPSFAVSALDTWLALLNGATLCLYNIPQDGIPGLATWLAQERITIYHSTASVFRSVMECLTEGMEFPDLRIIYAGGEPLYKRDVLRFQKCFAPECVLVSALGMSEAPFASQFLVHRGTELQTDVVPIGYPLDGMEVLLIDEDGQEVGINQTGEIVIKSQYLTPGYWLRPDLTQKAFLPDPQGTNKRLFYTGDLAFRLSDGCLIGQGRKDFRAKVRGHRVEMGDIEGVLNEFPGARQVAVMARLQESGDNRLVAYIVLEAGTQPDLSNLRRFILERLPRYMLPSAFVLLDTLPMTPSGKVDRRALPPPEQVHVQGDRTSEGPRTPVEEALVRIWMDVLGMDDVGIHDDFFDLGGHSLQVAQVAARVRDHFAVELPWRTYFTHSTLLELAHQIDQERKAGRHLAVPGLKPVPRTDALPTSFSQERLWLLDQVGEPLIMSLSLRIAGALDASALERSLTRLIQRHEILRTTFTLKSGALVQVIHPAPEVRLPVEDLREYAPEVRDAEAQRRAVELTKHRFNVGRDLLLAPLLLRMDDTEHLLIIAIHHIITDGRSHDVLMRDLAALYESCVTGAPPALPELPIQYADFATWQRQHLQGKTLDALMAYWTAQLASAPPALELPHDYVRPAQEQLDGASVSMRLPNRLYEHVKVLSRQEKATVFMVLLAGFLETLRRHTGQEDLAVGTPTAGRTRSETEPLIGLFADMLTLRTDVSGSPNFRELIVRVRDVALGAYEHQELPSGQLLRALRRNLDQPLERIMFSMDDVPVDAYTGAGVAMTRVEFQERLAHFDLRVRVEDDPIGPQVFAFYRKDLYAPGTIQRLLNDWIALLEVAVMNPSQSLRELVPQ